MKSIFFCAGEVSGDYQCSFIAKTIRYLDPTIRLIGIGGNKMKKAGVEILTDITPYSSIGIIESIIPAFQIYFNLKNLKKIIQNQKIDLIVLVDNQGLNLKIAKVAYQLKIPTCYYFPPHVSVWGRWNSNKLSLFKCHLLTPFYQDFIIYQQAGCRVDYVGHPLLEIVQKNHHHDTLKVKTEFVIGLFPGSRKQEIKKLLPILLKTANKLNEKYSITFLIPISSDHFIPFIQSYLLSNSKLKIKLIPQGSYSLYKLCNLVITCSGTVTLELGLLKVPMIVIYKLNIITYLIAKLAIKSQFISLPNLLLNDNIVIELLQKKVNPTNLLYHVEQFINNPQNYEDQKTKLSQLDEMLGDKNTIQRVSEIIIEKVLFQNIHK